jgi:hypothetical protein
MGEEEVNWEALANLGSLTDDEIKQLQLIWLSQQDPEDLEALRSFIAELRRNIIEYALANPEVSSDGIFFIVVAGLSENGPPPPGLVPDRNWLTLFVQAARGRGADHEPTDMEIAQWAYEAERALLVWAPHDDPSHGVGAALAATLAESWGIRRCKGSQPECPQSLTCTADFDDPESVGDCLPAHLVPLPEISAIGTWPFDRSRESDNDLQGVTHDADFWYMTQAKREVQLTSPMKSDESSFWKYHVSDNINATPERFRNPWEPDFRHMGDLDHVDGFLFVCLEDGQPGPSRPGAIGAIRTSDFAFVPGVGELPDEAGQDRKCPWVAFNPNDGFFYSSRSEDGVDRINRFTIDFDFATPEPRLVVKFAGSVPLLDENGAPFAFPSKSVVQGGAFSKRGRLYLSVHLEGCSRSECRENSGIFIVDVSTGRIHGHVAVDYDNKNENEELEGITIWDLDAEPRVHEGNPDRDLWGQLHVMMIQNEDLSNDDFYFKHFRTPRPDLL